MKCPEPGCGEERFYELSHQTTMIGGGYVEKGHHHNWNYHAKVYKCRNGHRFVVRYRELCPVQDCEFNRNLID